MFLPLSNLSDQISGIGPGSGSPDAVLIFPILPIVFVEFITGISVSLVSYIARIVRRHAVRKTAQGLAK